MTTIDEKSAAAAQGALGGRHMQESRKSLPRGIRRFFRFNLLALLIALFVVAIYFGVRQRFAVSRAENLAKQELWDLHASYTLKPAHPAWTQYALLQFGEEAQHVHSVRFPPYYPDVNDVREAKRLTAKDLALLARLPHLRKVDLSQTMFDEAALGALMHNRKLEELILSETLVGDEGIQRLVGHPTLSIVRLDRTLTSDASLKTLASLPELSEIVLDDATSEEGIAALTKAPKLKKVDAAYTSLLSNDLTTLLDRGVVCVPDREAQPLPPSPMDDASSNASRFRDGWWVSVSAASLIDAKFLDRLAASPNVSIVNVHDACSLDAERLADLLAEPQVLEIYLDVQGPPLSYASVEEVAKRVRPPDASPCVVYGNVAITGEELVLDLSKIRHGRHRSSASIYARYMDNLVTYAPYVVQDLRPEHVDRLNELSSSTEIVVQPHACGDPADLVTQSSLLTELSPVFVQIPIP